MIAQRETSRHSRRQSPGEMAAAATSHSLPSRGSVHATSAGVRVLPIQLMQIRQTLALNRRSRCSKHGTSGGCEGRPKFLFSNTD